MLREHLVEMEGVGDAGDVGIRVDLEGASGTDRVGPREREAVGGNGAV